MEGLAIPPVCLLKIPWIEEPGSSWGPKVLDAPEETGAHTCEGNALNINLAMPNKTDSSLTKYNMDRNRVLRQKWDFRLLLKLKTAGPRVLIQSELPPKLQKCWKRRQRVGKSFFARTPVCFLVRGINKGELRKEMNWGSWSCLKA